MQPVGGQSSAGPWRPAARWRASRRAVMTSVWASTRRRAPGIRSQVADDPLDDRQRVHAGAQALHVHPDDEAVVRRPRRRDRRRLVDDVRVRQHGARRGPSVAAISAAAPGVRVMHGVGGRDQDPELRVVQLAAPGGAGCAGRARSARAACRARAGSRDAREVVGRTASKPKCTCMTSNSSAWACTQPGFEHRAAATTARRGPCARGRVRQAHDPVGPASVRRGAARRRDPQGRRR